MNIMSFGAVIIITAILSVLLKRYLPEYSIVINLVAGAILIISLISGILPASEYIKSLLNKTHIPHEYEIILFKSLGICFITQFIYDACKDAGENSLASKIEIGGKISILLTALPLFEKIFSIALCLIGNQK